MTLWNEPFIIAVAAGAIRSSMPVLLPALGEVLTERSGIINLGLEGIMLVAAWSSVAVTFHTGSGPAGVLAAILVGMSMSLIHAVLCVKLGANQVAAGIGMMIFGAGTSALFGIGYVGTKIDGLQAIELPLLKDIPYLGSIFFFQDPLVYAAYLLVPIVALILYRTRFGLAVRAAGEDPEVAAAAGVQVDAVCCIATAMGGALAGLGGAHLALVYAQGWIENMTAGRGLIAIALVIFASWQPGRVALGALLFGVASSFQLRLQAVGAELSQYLLAMLPYVLVLVVLVAGALRTRRSGSAMPTALGKPRANKL